MSVIVQKQKQFSDSEILVQELIQKKRDKSFVLPWFQRHDFDWNTEQISEFIKFLVKGNPCTQIHLSVQMIKKKSTIYYIIDGRHRIWTIWGFYKGRYSYKDDNGVSIYYQDLTEVSKRRFLNYKISIRVLSDYSQDDLRQYFLDLQKGSPLHPGEKLNAINSELIHFIQKEAESSSTKFAKALLYTYKGDKDKEREGTAINSSFYASVSVNVAHLIIHGISDLGRSHTMIKFVEDTKELTKIQKEEFCKVAETFYNLFWSEEWEHKINLGEIYAVCYHVLNILRHEKITKNTWSKYSDFYKSIHDKCDSSKNNEYALTFRNYPNGKRQIEKRVQILKEQYKKYLDDGKINLSKKKREPKKRVIPDEDDDYVSHRPDPRKIKKMKKEVDTVKTELEQIAKYPKKIKIDAKFLKNTIAKKR